jgi:hypothetical protein
MFNEKIQRGDYFCTIDCTEVYHLSPNTVILPAEQSSILLKTHTTQKVIRSANQKVENSSPSGRTTSLCVSSDSQVSLRFPNMLRCYPGATFCWASFQSGETR